MSTIKCLIIAVLIAVAGATEGKLQGTIDDLEQKPSDLLSSLSAEITKSDVEITLSSLKIPEETTTAAIEDKDGSKNDKSGQEAAGISSTEDAQKITHSSEDNASFIHVKEKIARQSSDEEFAEADEQPKDGNTDDFTEHSKTREESDNLKNTKESHVVPDNNSESKTDKKEVENPESESEDIEDILKSDAAAVEDIDETMQSRRMLSFDSKFLDAFNTANVEVEPLLAVKSGENNYEHIPPGTDENDLVRDDYHIHHNNHEIRHGKPPGGDPLAFLPLLLPAPPLTLPPSTLPPLTLFHPPGKPLHPQFPPLDNIDKHPLSFDKSRPGVFTHHHAHPHHDESHNDHVNQHLKEIHHFVPYHYEQMQTLPALPPFQFTQTLKHDPPMLPSLPLPTFQPLPPSQGFHSFESWQPLPSFQAITPQPSIPSSLSHPPSKAVTSFQPPPKMDNIFPILHGVQQHPVYTEPTNQFPNFFPNNWNVGGFHSFSRSS